MNVRHMYPSTKFDGLDLRDFAGNDLLVVTIERVDMKTVPSKDFGQPKVDWYLFVRELKKQIKIPPRSGFEIAEILGEDDSERWIGRTIGIQAVLANVYGKDMWLVNFGACCDRKPILPPKTDLTGYASWSDQQKAQLHNLLTTSNNAPPPNRALCCGNDAASAPMGARTAAGIMVALRERDKDWTDLEADCRKGGCLELISGTMPPDCPIALAQRARVYCSLNPVVRKFSDADREIEIEKVIAGWEPRATEVEELEAGTVEGEVVNTATGEVTAAQTDAPTGDDIPF